MKENRLRWYASIQDNRICSSEEDDDIQTTKDQKKKEKTKEIGEKTKENLARYN